MSNKYELSITSTTVECYKIRHSHGYYWADITLDVEASGGRIMIASDYGSWQNYWGAAGPDFKKFLAGLDIHYAAGKFGCSDYFDHEGTIKMYRTRILQERHSDSITAELARQMWDETKLLWDDDVNLHSFQTCMWNECPGLMSWWDGTPDIRKTITPGFQNFWDHIWPVFIAELQKPKVEKFTVQEKSGVHLIVLERQRQVEHEGWNPVHDAHHTDESLASAAACYAMPVHTRQQYQSLHVKYGWYPRWWPASWDISWWKPTPKNRVRELVKAGALCAAEIDRIQNQEAYENSKP